MAEAIQHEGVRDKHIHCILFRNCHFVYSFSKLPDVLNDWLGAAKDIKTGLISCHGEGPVFNYHPAVLLSNRLLTC